MPTYPYRCRACEYEWESIHGMSDPVETACPSCGRDTADRQVAGGQSFDLRGSGWTPKFGEHYRNMRQADAMIHGSDDRMIHGREIAEPRR